jgi:integrase/recombinase XerD
VKPHIVSRRVSCLASFCQWAVKHRLVESDPIYLADKPKRPLRIPVWLDRGEQATLQAATRRVDNLPDTIFGRKREAVKAIRRRYEMLFGLLLASGLRISEALALRVRDVRLANGAARSLRVIGKGNKECLVPLPEAFGQVFGFWLANRPRDDFVFAQRPGGPPRCGLT